jgi:hypothetical protein
LNNDNLLFDSKSAIENNQASFLFENDQGVKYYTVAAASTSVTAPCGKAMIIFEVLNSAQPVVNGSTATNGGFITKGSNYRLDAAQSNFTFIFSLSHSPLTDPDNTENTICEKYMKSLLPDPEESDPYIIYYMIGLCCVAFIIVAILLKYGVVEYLWIKLQVCCCGIGDTTGSTTTYDAARRRLKRYSLAVHPFHPRHSLLMNRIHQVFLKKGYCVVCKHMDLPVFNLDCNHGICIEDLLGYLEAALGDISMFPVKCPMHYDGCTGTINSSISRRVLSKVQYEKFMEFSDRSLYGDGR